jgi:hypothetical protein
MPTDPSPTPEPASTRGIDPRGPRFGAALTSLLLAATIVLALTGQRTAALVLLAVIVALFALGATGLPHPWSLLFAHVVRPRLRPPAETEDPAPPRFAQLVGFFIAGVGLVLGLVGVPWAVPVFAALAFVAAFLNASIGFCLGCQIYLLLLRRRTPAPVA